MLSKINGLNLFKSSVLKAFVEALQLHSNTVSLVQWLNRLLPAQGGSGCVLGLHPHLQWNHVLLLAMSCYVDNLDVIQILALSPFSRRFTRLRTDNVKSRRLCHPSVDAPLGFALTM
jgi:hypothetical protein